MRIMGFGCALAVLCLLQGLWSPASAAEFRSAPEDPLLRALARDVHPDEDDYGCGPLLEAGAVYHVALGGNDAQDGLTPATAWRTLQHGLGALRAGDTLWIHEGEYYEPHALLLPGGEERSGRAGRPIRIMAVPGARVVISGAQRLRAWEPVPGRPQVHHSAWQGQGLPFVWEAGTQFELQYGGLLERVAELPGTFWVDEEAGRLYVRFTGGAGAATPGALVKGPDVGLDVHASYVLVRGLTFTNYEVGLAVRPGSAHVTIEHCAFFATEKAGIQLSSSQRCLVRDNRARRNGSHGSLFMHNSPRDEPDMADNLILRNHFHQSPSSLRTAGGSGYAIHHWNGSGLRNHIVDNLLTGSRSLWYKPVHRDVIVQGNVLTGAFDSESGTRSMGASAGEGDRIVVRGNTLLGGVHWGLELWGPGGPGGDWIGTLKAFLNNLHARGHTAGFADPAYHDYRLQADSTLRDEALGGGERGAFRSSPGRVLFVDARGGREQASGHAVAQAWPALATAAGRLQAGDTLYVLPGDYHEPLVINAAGTASAPIVVRAHGRATVQVPAIEVHGEYVTLEGFTVRQAEGDAILVTAPRVTLRHVLAEGYQGAGVRARGATGLTLRHCTLAGRGSALVLEQAATQTSLRDSILAGHPGADAALIDRSHDSTGFMASHNCYHGNMAAEDVAREAGSLLADPLFHDPAGGDYRLQWNSPAATLAAFAKPAGALSAVPRRIAITTPAATGILPDSAVILWRTPLDDTTGTVRYRLQGTEPWSETQSPEQGTVHGAGLFGLQPESLYELQVIAHGRRGGESAAPMLTFRTLSDMPAPQVYYLSPEGDDTHDGRSPSAAWRTTRRASQAVAPGDTVRMAPGDYTHVIAPLRGGLPGRRITFERHGAGVARLDGHGIIAPLVALVGVNHITIRGLDFDIGVGRMRPGLSTPAPSPGGVMRLKDCRDIEIIDCRGGSRAPLGMGGGTHFINTYNVQDLLIDRCVSWGARYHMRGNMPPPPDERKDDDPRPTMDGLTVRNSTFVHSQIQSFVIDGQARNIRFFNNIFYRPCGMPTKNNPVFLFRDAERPDFESDHNLFYSPVENHQMIADLRDENRRVVKLGTDLAAWQEMSGLERNSFRADPLFVNFAEGDFRLQPDSPAIGAGRDGATLGALGVMTATEEP